MKISIHSRTYNNTKCMIFYRDLSLNGRYKMGEIITLIGCAIAKMITEVTKYNNGK